MKNVIMKDLTEKEQLSISGGGFADKIGRFWGFLWQSHANSIEYSKGHPSVLPFK